MEGVRSNGASISLSTMAKTPDEVHAQKNILHQVTKYTKEHTQREKENSEEIKISVS